MSFNRNNYKKVTDAFAEKRLRAIEKAEIEKKRLYKLLPRIKEIDSLLSQTGLLIFEAALSGADKCREKMKKLEEDNLALQKEREHLLAGSGYPADATEPKFECPLCKDYGITESGMCECFRKALVTASIESSGLSKLIEKQTFDTFSIEYYRDSEKAYENIKFVLSMCRSYVENFSENDSSSLLFIGGTGLGKTHLSTAVAYEIVNRGFDVVYETAQNMIGDFEYERFEKSRYDSDNEIRTDKYFDCDLLVIDDLGTEVTNQFTVSCLYNIINTRIIRGKSTIINTNLSVDELRKRYSDRITSRLLGEFKPLLFMGSDIRQKKLRKNGAGNGEK